MSFAVHRLLIQPIGMKWLSRELTRKSSLFPTVVGQLQLRRSFVSGLDDEDESEDTTHSYGAGPRPEFTKFLRHYPLTADVQKRWLPFQKGFPKPSEVKKLSPVERRRLAAKAMIVHARRTLRAHGKDPNDIAAIKQVITDRDYSTSYH